MADGKQALKSIIESGNLPTLPAVASKLVSITADEDTTINEIADVITKDIALSAKILKVANSAFYGFAQQIGTIGQAVSIMGVNAVRSLVLSFSFLNIRKEAKDDAFDYKSFWERGLASAVSARLIMQSIDKDDAEEAFIAGLIQNIGEMVMARTFPKQVRQVQDKTKGSPDSAIAFEKKIIGASHAAIGHAVVKKWGFPSLLLAPVLYHHDPEGAARLDPRRLKLVQVVHLSDLVAGILYSDRPQHYHRLFREKITLIPRFNKRSAAGVLDRVHREISEVSGSFDMKIKKPRPVEDLLIEANASLSVLNLSYEQMNKELIAAKVQLEKLNRELKEKNSRLELLANRDGLTEVFNHRYFQHFLSREINRSQRKKTELSLILMDIDHFKKFNDAHGHQVGDLLLNEFCTVLGDNLRKYDLLARYGGEEFVVVLPETDLESATAVAEKLRGILASHIFFLQGNNCRATASFGVAGMAPATDSFGKDELIQFADKALYEAKKKGRNRVTVYQPKKKWFGKGYN